MRPRQTILVLVDLANSWQGPLFRKGVELSSSDRATVLDVYLQWLCLLLDLGYLDSGNFVVMSKRLFRDLISRDVLRVNEAFSELLSLVRGQSSKGFKGLCRDISNHLFAIVKSDLSDCLQSRIPATKRLMQLFSYTSRLSLRDIDLKDECLADYLGNENHIVDRYPDDLVHAMNGFIRSWMKTFDPTDLYPKHGKGAVADVPLASLDLKYRSLSSDQLIEYAYGEPYWIHQSDTLYQRVSKTIFVAKNYKTFRTISMEPATLQYLQQGVWKEIDRVVDSSYFLRTRIGFHDQTRNQRLARIGSLRRNFATIDLSAASDSVSYDLVKRLFKGTRMLRFLVATRSQWTILPNGDKLKLRKFAPMGSALCFPIETIIFAAACQVVTLSHGVPGTYSCFGDDLIVPTQCVGDLMNVLISLGFRINTRKSYYLESSWFRESCGIECCQGADVTPLRVSRKYNHERQSERITSLMKLSNLAFERGYSFLRSFFLMKLFSINSNVMFGPDALLGEESTNFHLRKRWNFDLQRLECWTIVLRTRYGRSDEEVRYRHWLESTAHRKIKQLDKWGYYHSVFVQDDDHFVSNVGRPTVGYFGTWMPKPFHETDNLWNDFFARPSSNKVAITQD